MWNSIFYSSVIKQKKKFSFGWGCVCVLVSIYSNPEHVLFLCNTWYFMICILWHIKLCSIGCNLIDTKHFNRLQNKQMNYKNWQRNGLIYWAITRLRHWCLWWDSHSLTCDVLHTACYNPWHYNRGDRLLWTITLGLRNSYWIEVQRKPRKPKNPSLPL